MLPHLSNRQKAALAVAFAVLLWFPSGLSTQTQPLVTGHSTFYNGSGFDPCLASIAGLVRSRVMWFNDMVLAERYAGRGTFIYVTEAGAPDPRERNYLYSEGVTYNFVDPNGVRWLVRELYMVDTIGAETKVAAEDPSKWGTDPGDPQGFGPDPAKTEARAGVGEMEERWYVWMVELADRPIHDQFAGDPTGRDYHDVYNFLVLVDTCKFRKDNPYKQPVWHNATDGWMTGGFGHATTDQDHNHTARLANLWIGGEKTVVAAGVATDGVTWQSEWLASEQGQDHVQRTPQQTMNQTAP